MSKLEKTENIKDTADSIDNTKTSSFNMIKLNDINGNDITIEDTKTALIQNNELIQRVINGDNRAFNELYMQSYRYVFFITKQYISDDETVYDAMQEAFIKVYKNISNLRDPAAYYSWLTSIAKNTAIDVLRIRRDQSMLVYEEKSEAFIKDEQTKKDVSLDIKSVLKEMNPDDAELLSLVYYDGMRISHIAKMQGIPTTTVYSRFNKAKKNFKAQLKVHGIDKAVYSGNFVGMITVGIRNIIGTSLLSWSIAQQMLDSIVTKKDKKELSLAKIILAQQKKTILKIASCIVALSMLTSAITVLVIVNRGDFKNSGNANHSSKETSESDSNSSKANFSNNSVIDYDENSINNDNLNDKSSNNQENSDITDNSSDASSVDFTSDFWGSDVNEPVIDDAEPLPSVQEDNPAINDEVINTIGNNPNNVMRAIAVGTELGGLVAKQGDWLYYVQSGTRLVKMKIDGSDRQILYEATGFTMISNLNVIGDTIYYTNGGIWSIKTDGTERRQISSKTAYNLLVRGTTGWFVVPDKASDTPAVYMHYSLYQMDLLTGEVITIVENGAGYGLKTVIDNSLIYVNGNNVYKRDLSTGVESVIKQFDFALGIYNMCVNGNTIYFCGGSTDKRVIEIEINNPDVIKAKYKFGDVYNYFNFGGGVLYGRIDGGASAFYTLQGEMLFGDNANIRCDTGVYTFDDGYAYYYDEDLSELYRCLPDGTDYKVY